MIYQQTKSYSKRFIRLEDIVEMFTLYLYSWTLTVTLTLKIATHILYMTLWFIIMLHHTKFGYKRLVEKIWSGQNLDGWIHRHRDCNISPWLHYAGYNNNQNTKQQSIKVLPTNVNLNLFSIQHFTYAHRSHRTLKIWNIWHNGEIKYPLSLPVLILRLTLLLLYSVLI